MPKLPAEAYAIIEGRHSDPFHYLGLHPEGGRSVVRAFLPEAVNVEAVGEHGEVAPLDRVHDAGLFIGALPNGSQHYQLRAKFGNDVVEFEDAYRFPPILTDFDLYLLGEGTHQRLYDKLGAHPMQLDGVDGIGFVVLAPNARRVSVVGDFNFWDGRRHPMRVRGSGYWELFIPHAKTGDHYKFPPHRPAWSSDSAEIRSAGIRERGAAEDGVHRVRRSAPAAAAAGARRHQFTVGADVGLRGPSRLVAAQERQ
jgi:1,4-alpha-glucan branching enzyme